MADEKPESEGLVSPTDDPERFMATMRERLTAEAEPEEQPGEGEAPPAPTAEASTPASPAEGAEEASASPQPAPTSWRDIPIPEEIVERNKFFRDRKLGDLYDSYDSLVSELQKRGKRERELETENIALKTWKEMAGAARVEPPPPPDPFAGLDPDVDPVVNPAKWQAAQQVALKRELESAAEKAKREALEEFEARQAKAAYQQHEAAVINALTSVQKALELDDERFADLAPALLQGVTRRSRGDIAAQTNPNAYLEVAKGLGFGPKPAVTAPPPLPPPVTPPANPPGAKTSGKAAPADAARSNTPTLSYERRMQLKKLREAYAAQHGEDAAEEFYQRTAAKFAQERG